MIHKEKCLVLDLDGTLCPIKRVDQNYCDLVPVPEVFERLKQYKREGFHIILYTARNMRTHEGNLGKIMAHTAKSVLEWLDSHGVPYDEIHFGKPWAGRGGFYVDDKAIRPSEFIKLSYDEILQLVGNE